VGDSACDPIRLSFNPQLRVEFRGATGTSDAGLLLPRELDERLGLGVLIERQSPILAPDATASSSPGRPVAAVDLQPAGRVRGTNDALRLSENPTFRMLPSRERRDTTRCAHVFVVWFETDVLAEERNYQGLTRLNAELLQHPATRSRSRRVVLDIDSSESPVHGAQEQSAYNGHFESLCHHPALRLQPEDDCLAAKLRSGNVHNAEALDEVLLPIIDRYRRRRQSAVVRADATFAMQALLRSAGTPRMRYAI